MPFHVKPGKRPVVFLDRDGTLNVEAGYLRNISDLVLLPGAAQALTLLNRANVAAVLVTNQSGPARGLYPEWHVQKLNDRLCALLDEGGAVLDAVYYCPHHPQGVVPEYAINCSCRKPKIGLIERAFVEHPDLDRQAAYMIGDQSTDVELARNASLKSVLVKTGYGADVLAGKFQWMVEPDFVAETLADAVSWVLAELERQGSPDVR